MWTIIPERSSVCFRYGYENLAISQGNFQHFSGMVLADRFFKALNLMLYVETATIKAVDPAHDPLLLSGPYFDSATYPVILFHSGRSVQPYDGHIIHLQLTLKGIARPAILQIIKTEILPKTTETLALLTAQIVLNASEFEMGNRELHDPDNELMFEIQLVFRNALPATR